MTKVRTTLTIDEEILRAIDVRAARQGKSDSEVVEEILRRELGFDLLWERADMSNEEAVALAVGAQHATRDDMRWMRAGLDSDA